jgi:hypothetical protein
MRVARLCGFARPFFFERGQQGRARAEMEPTERISRTCEECSNWKDVKQRIKIAKLLDSLIGGIETRIKDKELKPTMAEYLKLLQMEQEIEQESPKEIKVTWVDPATISNGEK